MAGGLVVLRLVGSAGLEGIYSSLGDVLARAQQWDQKPTIFTKRVKVTASEDRYSYRLPASRF
jgi:hypothetical protein